LTIDEIREAFSFFDSWEDKYRFVIDLGKSLPTMNESDRSDDNLVRGCQSQVWLNASYDADANRLHFEIDSDAHIVRGLIAIVLAIYQDQSPAYVRDHDVEQIFDDLELLQHLSPTRGNGLRAMVSRIRQEALRHC
jgi:cysteine desulfuration protein SufE